MAHSSAKPIRCQPSRFEDEVRNNARFLKSWFQRPLTTGAVSPSGKGLARMIASFVDPDTKGPVIELGPGTGPVTEALVERGVAEDRLVLLEYSADFCRLLRSRFPRATVVQGDAYAIGAMLGKSLARPASAIVSSLPLLTKPEEQRLSLVDEALSLADPASPFIQFTYGNSSPVPLNGRLQFDANVSRRVWRNIPPARVWVYRQA